MNIIKKGENKSLRKYTAECPNCGCIFEFMRSEAKLRSKAKSGKINLANQYDGNELVVYCPEEFCQNTIIVKE